MKRVLLICLLVLLMPDWDLDAQRERGRRRRSVERMDRDIFPGNAFTFCRIEYSSGGGRSEWGGRRRGWGSWAVDYPESDENFSLRLSQITTLNVNRTEEGRFKHVVVRLDDAEVFKYPFTYMLEVGGMQLSGAEQEGLRAYLLRGGFLLVDDFWGDRAWENWMYEIEQVLPSDEFPMVDIPLDHELFHIVFDIKEVPQVPGLGGFWEWESTGVTYEGHESRYYEYGSEAHCRGIFDHNGRLMVVVMHNSDLGDGWEREGENYEYFRMFSAPKAYPMGINIVVYAMTH